MTDKDKPDIQNSGISNEAETMIQTPTPTDDKTLAQDNDALTEKIIEEPTQKLFSTDVDVNAKTQIQTISQIEPTEILLEDEVKTNEELAESETTLKPSKIRFVLVCILFSLLFINFTWIIYQAYSIKSRPSWSVKQEGKSFRIDRIEDDYLKDKLQVGDEIISLNGQPYGLHSWFRIGRFELNEPYTLEIKRNEVVQSIEIANIKPDTLNRQLFTLVFFLMKAAFLLTALFVFLLKPNDKLVLLMALTFCVLGAAFSGDPSQEMPLMVRIASIVIYITYYSFFITFFHFFLIFPQRPRFVRRFPKIEWLIYLPLPFFITYGRLSLLESSDLIPTNKYIDLLELTPLIAVFYFLGGLIMLLLNYFRSSKASRRKLNVIVAGVFAGFSPIVILLSLFMITSIIDEYVYNSQTKFSDNFNGIWVSYILTLALLLVPLSFAYAILKHKVIPVSFIIRRGLQYLLAKNALRLLLILPVVGIIWNIAANPNRTLSEILLNNSFSFYFFIVVAVVDGLLMRSRLNEWVDRKFFREQYNQEKILRELTETVKESDSLAKLSRLVSSKIQTALHPENVYLFYRDDEHNSDFSLGYASSGAETQQHGNVETNQQSEIPNPKSQIERLAADSPLLRFMQTQRGAVEFPSRKTDELPDREKRWLSEIEANLLVPMHGTDGKLAGIFLLGEKLSQIPYTGRDKELLETLANQIALVHENLNLKDRMRREQRIKTEVLARFDEGNINLLKECPKCGRCFDREAINCTDDNSKLTFTLPVERTVENRYRLEKLLGRGGMGAVYEAADLRLNRTVALKIISGASFGNRDALRRFEREAQASARLNHRNIVTVFDYGTLSTEGAFLVMELVKGASLRRVFEQKGTLDLQTTIEWFGQVLDGVEAAHKAGIIHRDLKPENILFRNEEGKARLRILDFGLARFSVAEAADGTSVTAPGTVMGTLGYMPPEQLRGERVDERCDLFAVSVMIYEAVYGKRPFEGNSYLELTQAMTGEIKIGESEPLADFFKRGLSLKPENRFASANEMKNSLFTQTK